MHHKHLFLALIIGSFFTLARGMQDYEQDNTEYNLSHILNLTPEDVWLQIIARSDAKDAIRKTCSYFRDCASTKNKKLFLQIPLVIAPEVLERFALYYADFAHDSILNNLLYHGANPNSADDSGNSVMHYAVQNGNLEMVKTLLQHPQFDKKNMATNENSTLFLAAQGKHTKIVEHILSQCTIDYNAMLCLAIHYGLSDFTTLLLTHMSHDTTSINTEAMWPPEKNTSYKRRKMSALHYATIKGDTDTAQILISNGMHVDTADTDNSTPFHYALSHNITNMINLFMNNKANIHHVCNSGQTSLHKAVRSGLMTKALFLLNHGANINTKNTYGNTALHIASANGHNHLVKLLLAYNADINERNNDGATALSQAFNNHQLSIVHLLLSQPDIDATQSWKDKQTLLHRIIINSQYDHDRYKKIINLVLQKTDINALDVYGNSPLSYTYWHHNIPLLQKLLEQPTININALHGQNLSDKFQDNVRDNYGYKRKGSVTVLDLAMRHQNTEFVDLLMQHGAQTRAQLEEDGLLDAIDFSS